MFVKTILVMPVLKKVKLIQDKWVEVISDRGLKQSWVAHKAKISPSHLSNVLSKRVLLTKDVADRINKALNTDFNM